jgi:hypothetical protein
MDAPITSLPNNDMPLIKKTGGLGNKMPPVKKVSKLRVQPLKKKWKAQPLKRLKMHMTKPPKSKKVQLDIMHSARFGRLLVRAQVKLLLK